MPYWCGIDPKMKSDTVGDVFEYWRSRVGVVAVDGGNWNAQE